MNYLLNIKYFWGAATLKGHSELTLIPPEHDKEVSKGNCQGNSPLKQKGIYEKLVLWCDFEITIIMVNLHENKNNVWTKFAWKGSNTIMHQLSLIDLSFLVHCKLGFIPPFSKKNVSRSRERGPSNRPPLSHWWHYRLW